VTNNPQTPSLLDRPPLPEGRPGCVGNMCTRVELRQIHFCSCWDVDTQSVLTSRYHIANQPYCNRGSPVGVLRFQRTDAMWNKTSPSRWTLSGPNVQGYDHNPCGSPSWREIGFQRTDTLAGINLTLTVDHWDPNVQR